MEGADAEKVKLNRRAPLSISHLPPGEPPEIADHVVLERIGAGAYGEVWMARSITGAPRAVKVVYRERFDHERTYEREFAGLRNFEPISRAHEGLVDILQVGRNEAAGYFYSVMELADDAGPGGGETGYTPSTVAERVRQGRLPIADCARVGAAVSGALAFLHGRNLIHRDVKPSNIIFVNGQPKLADIGLVAAVGEARSFVGTDGFIPPEGPGTPRGDIYGLGKTLYEMATGRNRLDFPDLPGDLDAAGDGPAFLELNEIILKACAEFPEDRHQSAEDLRGELLLLDAGRSIRQVRLNERLVRIWRRLGIAALAVFLVGAFALSWERRRSEAASREAAEQARQRREVEAKERAARENLYAADMNLAQQAIESGNYGRAETLLSGYLPGPGLADLRGFEWHYYWRTIRGDSVDALRGHEHVVSSLALSADGKRLFSGSFDGTIREWSLESRAELSRWTLPGSAFQVIALDPANARIASEGGNRPLSSLLDLQSGSWITNASSDSPSVSFTPDGQKLVRAARTSLFETNGVIEIVDLRFNVEKVIPESGGHATFAPGGKMLATGSWGDAVKLWTWPELALLGTLPGAGTVLGLSFSPDGSKLATVSREGDLCVWDAGSLELLARTATHGGAVIWSVAFSPDGQRLATAGNDQTVRAWSVNPLEEIHVYRGHRNEVWAVIWSADGRRLISSSKDMTIRIWDASPAAPEPEIADVIQAPVFSSDGSRAAARIRGDTAVVWQLPGGAELMRIPSVVALGGFTRDALRLVVLSREGEVQQRLLADGSVVESRRVQEMPLHFNRRLLSPSGRWLITGFREGETLVEDTLATNAPVRLRGGGEVTALAVSPDEKLLLVGALDRSARLWELSGGKLLRVFGNHRMAVGAVAFAGDGKTVATGSWDDTIHVWDLGQERERMILEGHEGGVQAVAFAPDGRTLAGVTGTSILKYWSLPAQREAGQIQLRSGTRQAWASFSGDGKWLAAVSQAEALRFFAAPREENSKRR